MGLNLDTRGCEEEGCPNIYMESRKAWAPFSEMPEWAFGSFTHRAQDGTDSRDKFKILAGIFNSGVDIPDNHATFQLEGQTVPGIYGLTGTLGLTGVDIPAYVGDIRHHTRYRTCLFRNQITVSDGMGGRVTFAWSLEETYHAVSGVCILRIAQQGDTLDTLDEFYSYELDEAGTVTESGDMGDFDPDNRISGALTLNTNLLTSFGGAPSDPGYREVVATIAINATSARLDAEFPEDMIGDSGGQAAYRYQVDLSDEYPFVTWEEDAVQMWLDAFQPEDLENTYDINPDDFGDDKLHWNGVYTARYVHAGGTAMHIRMSGEDMGGFPNNWTKHEPQVTETNPSFDTMAEIAFGYFPFFVEAKSLNVTDCGEMALQNYNLDLPTPATEMTLPPDTPIGDNNGDNGGYTGATNCLDPYINGCATFLLDPDEMSFPYGYATLARRCNEAEVGSLEPEDSLCEGEP